MDIISQFPEATKLLTVDKVRVMTIEQLLRLQAYFATNLYHETSALKIQQWWRRLQHKFQQKKELKATLFI